MVDTVWTFIQVTLDCPGLNKSEMVPILDLQVRMEDHQEEVEGLGRVEVQQIIWRFYEKPMNSPYVILEASAMPIKVKITTMVQEVIRRMRNMNEKVEEREVKEELSKFCMKMKRSGYGEAVRRDVILSGYKRMRRNQEEGRRKMYRKQEEGKELRWAMKIKGKETWYKGKNKEEGEDMEEDGRETRVGGGRYIGGIWWKEVDKANREEKNKREEKEKEPPSYTPDGILKRRLQERDTKMVESMGLRKVKFIERGGRSVQGILCKSNPWKEKECGGKDCLVCKTEAKGECRVELVVYQVECGKCE